MKRISSEPGGGMRRAADAVFVADPLACSDDGGMGFPGTVLPEPWVEPEFATPAVDPAAFTEGVASALDSPRIRRSTSNLAFVLSTFSRMPSETWNVSGYCAARSSTGDTISYGLPAWSWYFFSFQEVSLPPGFDGILSWGMVDNRPFLRCLHGYGLSLWKLGRADEAKRSFERQLAFNPPDNQGVRFLLEELKAGKPWEERPDR